MCNSLSRWLECGRSREGSVGLQAAAQIELLRVYPSSTHSALGAHVLHMYLRSQYICTCRTQWRLKIKYLPYTVGKGPNISKRAQVPESQ